RSTTPAPLRGGLVAGDLAGLCGRRKPFRDILFGKAAPKSAFVVKNALVTWQKPLSLLTIR
ncbi:MAG: hypothetical protein KKA78_21475, partial [Alphaproteobacteria bacterium]|nr:hypothetical protein [Alphaproteobacteria bacterium]